MQYRGRLAFFTLLLLIGLGLWGWRDFDTSNQTAPAKAPSSDPNIVPTPPESFSRPSVTAPKEPAPIRHKITFLSASALADELHSPESSGADDLHLIDSLFIAYRQAIKANPSGENYEIIEALTGGNAKRIAVFPPNHPAISNDGTLLDRWGSPYHFHSISASNMEIRSAGPDRILWSDDDILQAE